MPRKAKGQPISAAPNQGYGERKAQEDAQRAAPMAEAGDVLAEAQSFRPSATPIDAPGDPNQPFTSGMPVGPGPGPEAVAPPTLEQTTNLDALVAAPLLNTLGHLAAGRRLSPSTVRFMRLLRAELPVGFDTRQLANEDPSGT